MNAVLTLDGTKVPLTERPMDWIGSVVIDGYKYRVVVELYPVGPVLDPAGDGSEEEG